MKPIIEVQTRKRTDRRATYRDWLIARHPISGGVIARRMIGKSLSSAQIAERSIQFTKWVLEWFIDPNHGRSIISHCDEILL